MESKKGSFKNQSGVDAVAVPHMKIKIGGLGKASPHAEYIARLGQYAKRLDRDEELEYTENGNMPSWAKHNPLEFWQAADLHERKNGSTYREFEISLPRELNEQQRIDLVKNWVEQEIGDKHPYSLAIHNPKALDGGEQPHVHIMFNERKLDGIDRDPEQYFRRYNSKNPDRGGAQKLNTGKDYATRKDEIKAIRERWQSVCNTHLENAGLDTRVNLKSLKEQGIDRAPERKYMPSEIKDPDKCAELTAFRHARKTAQNRPISTKDLSDGISTTLDRFDAYKRDIAHMKQLRDELRQRNAVVQEQNAIFEAKLARDAAAKLASDAKLEQERQQALARAEAEKERALARAEADRQFQIRQAAHLQRIIEQRQLYESNNPTAAKDKDRSDDFDFGM